MTHLTPVFEKVPTLAECHERSNELAQAVMRHANEAHQAGIELSKSFRDLCILADYYLKMEVRHADAANLNQWLGPKEVSDEKRAREYFCKGYKEFADASEIA
ncbi:MAG TPA: hypothetical protein VGG46_06705 [Terriglobales bacterium]|jgi:hypothetical protein